MAIELIQWISKLVETRQIPGLVMIVTVCELENGPIEIVELPMKHGDFPVR